MNSEGQTIQLQPVPLSQQYQISHDASAMFAACNGTGSLPGTNCRMNGFNNEESEGGPTNPQYVYVPHSESKPYFDMAHEWVVGDRMFQSQLDESFAAHQYVIAAQDQSSVDLPAFLPWGCQGGSSDVVSTITQSRNPNGPVQRACFDYTTLGDELDAAKLTWRFYAVNYQNDGGGNGGTWSAYQAVNHIFNGKDWKNVISPNCKFIEAVRAGNLANFTWITPNALSRTTRNAQTAVTDRRGLPRSSIPWGRASSGIRRRSSSSGTIGAATTTTLRRRSKTTMETAFACRFSSSHRTLRRTSCRISSLKRRASYDSLRTSTACPRWPRRMRAPRRPPQIASILRNSPGRSSRSKRRIRPNFFIHHRFPNGAVIPDSE